MREETRPSGPAMMAGGGEDEWADGSEVNAENWRGHEDEINRMFSLYHKTINPMVSIYNSLENKFPDAVLNELRAAFSHMTQSLLEEDPGEVGRHLDKAERHMKRAAIDGFKYAARAYARLYDDIKAQYQGVDLSFVRDGRFLPEVTRLRAEASRLLHEAKLVEADVHADEKMFEAYGAMYAVYAELYDYLLDNLDAIETISMRAAGSEESRRKEHNTDRIIAVLSLVIGTAVGIAGIIIGAMI